MLRNYFVNFINLFLNALMFLIFIRVILSWIPSGLDSFRRVVNDLTEPFLGPLRKIVPPIAGAIDLTPLIAFIILSLIQDFIGRL